MYLYSNLRRMRALRGPSGGLRGFEASKHAQAHAFEPSRPPNMHRLMLSSLPAYFEHASRPQNMHRLMLSSLRAYFEHASKPQNSITFEETRLRSHWTKHFEGTGDEVASKTRYFRRDRSESSRRSSSKPLDEALRRHWTKQLDEETGRRDWTKKLNEETGRRDWTKKLDEETGRINFLRNS